MQSNIRSYDTVQPGANGLPIKVNSPLTGEFTMLTAFKGEPGTKGEFLTFAGSVIDLLGGSYVIRVCGIPVAVLQTAVPATADDDNWEQLNHSLVMAYKGTGNEVIDFGNFGQYIIPFFSEVVNVAMGLDITNLSEMADWTSQGFAIIMIVSPLTNPDSDYHCSVNIMDGVKE